MTSTIQNIYSTKATVLAFFVPFVLGGIFFAILGVGFERSLPPIQVGLIDLIYTVFLAFIDMGTACGLGSLVVLSLARKVVSLKWSWKSQKQDT